MQPNCQRTCCGHIKVDNLAEQTTLDDFERYRDLKCSDHPLYIFPPVEGSDSIVYHAHWSDLRHTKHIHLYTSKPHDLIR